MCSVCGVSPHTIPTFLPHFRFSLKAYKPYTFLPLAMIYFDPLSPRRFCVIALLYYALVHVASCFMAVG